MEFYNKIFLVICVMRYSYTAANNMKIRDGVSNAEIINGDTFFEILEPSQLKYTYRLRPARNFGGQFNDSVCMKNAKLVPVNPIECCTEPLNGDYIEGNVAFAVRGSCSFLYKTLMAEQAGARAIIITEVDGMSKNVIEETSPDQFIEMIDDKSNGDPNIPAGFLLGRNGLHILKTLSRLRMPYAIINLPINMTYVPLHRMNQPPWTSW